MNREEQIISEAKKYYSDSINCYNAFLHGVEWADEHPVDVGLNPDDFKNLKWEDEPVEVFVNLED